MHPKYTPNPDTPASKVCHRCGLNKPVTDYYQDRAAPDGRRKTCIDCDKIRKRTAAVREQSHRYYHSEKGKAAEKRYNDSAKGKAARAAYTPTAETLAHRKESQPTWSRRWYVKKGRAHLAALQADPEWREKRAAYLADYLRRPHIMERLRAHKMARLAARNQRSEARQIRGDRRHLLRRLPATLTRSQWNYAVAYFNYRCAYCGETAMLAKDHFVPVVAGGPFTASNIVPACKPCNSSKHAKLPEDWCTADSYARIMQYFTAITQ